MLANIQKGLIYIYVLIDPRTFDVRYVGKTNNPKERMFDHTSLQLRYILNPNKKHKWVQELAEQNLKPIMQVLISCPADQSENYEYRYYKLFNHGNNLLNSATIQKETMQMTLNYGLHR